MIKKEDKKIAPELIGILATMSTYLIRQDNNFHSRLSLIYCDSCHAISSAGGDYYSHEGNDCFGAHYKLNKKQFSCTKCHTTEFIEITPYSDLRVLKDRNPEEISLYIANGLKRMSFSSLYSEELPAAKSRWDNLSKKDKIKQILKLIKFNDGLDKAKQKVESLEACLEK